MLRAPNPTSPEEVRRAIQRQRIDSDAQGDAITDIDASVSVLDSRVDVLEEAAVYSAESDDSILAGQPVYIKATGHAGLAVANDSVKSAMVGFALAAAEPTYTVQYATEGKLTLSDWTAVAGSTSLTSGAAYYLDSTTEGKIASTAPTSGYVVFVGRAVSATALDIEVKPSIRL